jgi:hypothetical protein
VGVATCPAARRQLVQLCYVASANDDIIQFEGAYSGRVERLFRAKPNTQTGQGEHPGA